MTRMSDYRSIYNFLYNLNSENYIDTAIFSLDQVEEDFKNTKLDVTGKKRHDFVEKKLNAPSFIVIFYYYIYFFKSIPTQQQFISLYNDINKNWIYNNVRDEYLNAFNGRLSRTYPSLVRDVHCYILLKESNEFNRVVYVNLIVNHNVN